MDDRRLVIHTDPAGTLPPADIILLTGAVRCSRADILAASTPQTVVAGPADCLQDLPLNQLVLRAGQTQRVLGVDVTAAAVPGGLSYVMERPAS